MLMAGGLIIIIQWKIEKICFSKISSSISVIDFCLTKNLMCDQDTNYTSLQLAWASRANCDQRKGQSFNSVHRVYKSY